MGYKTSMTTYVAPLWVLGGNEGLEFPHAPVGVNSDKRPFEKSFDV
jgi:hypothetical protein